MVTQGAFELKEFESKHKACCSWLSDQSSQVRVRVLGRVRSGLVAKQGTLSKERSETVKRGFKLQL